MLTYTNNNNNSSQPVINFILLGASGNLAKIKIFPAFASFINQNPSTKLKLIPWSRKGIDLKLIKKQNLIGDELLTEQIIADYIDIKAINSYFESLTSNTKTIFYLALPSVVNRNFVALIASLKYRNLQIIIEKPYAVSKEDMYELDDIIFKHRLEDKVLFIDHYLFKPQLIIKPALANFLQTLSSKKISTVNIDILEQIDIDGRFDFYEQTGGIMDMFFHHFSLYSFLIKNIYLQDGKQDSVFINTHFALRHLVTGQYQDYKNQVSNQNSNTETAFGIVLENERDYNNELVMLQSGKNLDDKKTAMFVSFADGSNLSWLLYPQAKLDYNSIGSYFSYNFKDKELDHYYMFESLYYNDISKFVNIRDIKAGWDVLNKIIKKKPEVVVY
jgi:glucose-6-phosphate 1-dehydrogenase